MKETERHSTIGSLESGVKSLNLNLFPPLENGVNDRSYCIDVL